MSEHPMLVERSFAFERTLATLLALLGFAALGTQLYLFVVTQITQGDTAAWGLVLCFGYFTDLPALIGPV